MQAERVRRLGWVRTLEIPAPVWKDSQPQKETVWFRTLNDRPAPYSWTAEGNRLVTAWGTVLDLASGKETGSTRA